MIGPAELHLTVVDQSHPSEMLAAESLPVPAPDADPRGAPLQFDLANPPQLLSGHTYQLRLSVDGPGQVALYGAAPANETDWDMGLPLRVEGYDGYGGLYQRGLNFQMYWDDNVDKLLRFEDTLNQSDYIFISSNRQWGTTTRLPERYPLTTTYYRDLMGCPPALDVETCYRSAEVGDYQGRLGFQLVRVFESYPNLGPLRFNTQYAEEAFTVYDHPKVFIFKKQPGYDPAQVRALLGAVDLSDVVHLTPKKASDWNSLMLTPLQMVRQESGGAWVKLFPPGNPLNQSQPAAVVAWWLFLLLLGWLAYPILRLVLPGLSDRGYPLARVAGLLLLAYPVWLLGSSGIAVTPLLIGLVLLALALVSLWLAYRGRAELLAGLRAHWRYLLGVEALALLAFGAFLYIRWLNPDLWHLYFGGEKPMDFSYFNAVLKSTIFPPYDPWFAGGEMNYYYFGFVLVGMPVKLLGITPAVAYNLILPAVYSMAVLGAFCLGYNLVSAAASRARPWLGGLFGSLLMMALGNQGTVRMVWQAWQRLIVSQEAVDAGGFFQHLLWAFAGFKLWLAGAPLPIWIGDWYWLPSRAIVPAKAGEITEFPFFSFLYADLHAHMLALPVTLLVLAWALSVVLSRGQWGRGWGRWLLGLTFGALAAGVLRAANTWDQPTYLALASLALLYAWLARLFSQGLSWRRALAAGASLALLVGLSYLLFQPFNANFHPGYNEILPWQGHHTNLSSYLVHWGLFLFILAAWLFDELVDWMSATPLSSLRRVWPYRAMLLGLLAALALLLAALLLRGVVVAVIILPLGVASGLLLLRPDQPAAKRFVLFLVGTGLTLTLAVELIALQGDRMNTVFKFYFQAWTLLAISAAAALAWLLPRLIGWAAGWRWAWTAGLALLIFGAGLNTVTSTAHKVVDRMAPSAPHTLDGMAYMQYATLLDGPPGGAGLEMNLAQDAAAIHWMQLNIPGSPVIVEAHTQEYRHWGNRYTIYTGLPGVIGWEVHQRQQRAVLPSEWITERIVQIAQFYRTTDPTVAREFLQRYGVQYVIVGQLERIYYPGPGLEKFQQLEGQLWQRVYSQGDTEIYRVLP